MAGKTKEKIRVKANSRPIDVELTAGSADGGGPMSDVGASYATVLSNVDDPVLAAKGGGLKLYEKVLQDDQVHSNFQQRRLALIAKELEIKPGADDKQSVAAADFLRDNICSLQFDHICNKMSYGIFYGYGVGECLWARDGRHWTLDNVKVRKARRFTYDTSRQLRLVKSGEPQGVLMPERKFWTFESGADNDDNPFGVGLASWCYWPAFFKRNGVRFWMLALEKYGAPTAVGKYPANATKEEKKKLLEAVMAFASVSGVTIPEGMDIELLAAGSKVGGNHDVLVKTMDKAISKVILSQTMTTDDGSSNSQAKVHEGVADDITAADADLQCGSFMAGPGRWLTEWNYPGATLPVMRRKTEPPEDLDKQAERDSKLYTMGYRPTPDRIRETYGDGYERVEPPQAENPAKNNSALPGLGAPKSNSTNTGAEFEATDFMELDEGATALDKFLASDDHAAALETETDGFISQIEAALKDADGDEDTFKRLLSLLGVPEDDPLAIRLAQAQFSAHLLGRRIDDPDEEA